MTVPKISRSVSSILADIEALASRAGHLILVEVQLRTSAVPEA